MDRTVKELLAQLTPAERIILQQSAEGNPNKAITAALYVGEDTAKSTARTSSTNWK